MNDQFNKNYIDSQKNQFENSHELMIEENHIKHNNDPEYWNILLKEIKENRQFWFNKKALDFGCGCGRNIKNLLDLVEWDSVDGCDISYKNAIYAKNWVNQFYKNKTETWETNGCDIQPCKENTYDFIMSHIVFQHISNYNVRFSIISDIFKCLKPNGLASLHFADMLCSNKYYESLDINQNCSVENSEFLINDFKKIGFKNISCETGTDFFMKKQTSYYIKGYK